MLGLPGLHFPQLRCSVRDRAFQIVDDKDSPDANHTCFSSSLYHKLDADVCSR